MNHSDIPKGAGVIEISEMTKIQNELNDVIDGSYNTILSIKNKVNEISPIREFPSAEQNTKPSEPEMPSVVNSLRYQIRRANENAALLRVIAEHLTKVV